MAPSGYLGHIQRLRRSTRRQLLLAASAYCFTEREHYGHLRTVRAWTFLSGEMPERLPEFQMALLVYVI